MNKIKKYKLIIFDIDGTITNIENSWRYMHEYFDTWNYYKENLLPLYEKNLISYHQLCKKEANLWKNKDSRNFIYNLRQNLKPVKNLYSTLDFFKSKNFQIIAISSGLQFVPQILNLEKFFDEIFHNELDIENNFFTGEININVENTKIKIFQEYVNNQNFKYDEIIFVGDGKSDIHIAKKVGIVISVASKSLELSDLASFSIQKDKNDEIDFESLKEYISKIQLT
jgi:HAD superfamily phosphoserine phosphatase-like hydrolase